MRYQLATWAFVSLGLAAAYWLLLRPILRQRPELAETFARLDALEAGWLARMKARLEGWKTVILARIVWLAGALVGLHDFAMPMIAGQDWTPVTAQLPAWAVPLGLLAIGLLFAKLRKISTGATPAAGG